MSKRKAAYGTGHLRRRGNVWYIKLPVGSGEFIYRTSRDLEKGRAGTRQDALNLRDELLGKRHRNELGEQPGNTTVNRILDHLIEVMQNQKLKSADDVKLVVDRHLRPALGTKPADSLKTKDLQAYRSKLTADDRLSHVSVNRHFSYLRRAYNLAKITSPPLVKAAPSFVGLMAKEDNARQGFMTSSQYTKLRDELPEYLRPLFVCAYWTGVRAGELLSIRWSQVQFAATGEDIGCIILRTGETKSGEGRLVPIVPEMDKYLRQARQWLLDHGFDSCPWVFYRFDRMGLGPIKDFRAAWEAAVQRAAVFTEQGAPLRFHDLRRTATMHMTDSGLDPVTAMQITGHKTMSMFLRYNIQSKNRVLRAGRLLAGLEKSGDA